MSRTVTVIWSLVGLLVVALLVAAWFLLVDTGALQARAESALSDALHTDAEARGGLRVRLLPTPRLVLNDVVAGDDVSVNRLELVVAPLSLLRGDPSVRSVVLHQPDVTVRRDEDGQFRIAGLGADNGAGEGATLSSVQVTDARVTFFDENDEGLDLSGCDVQLQSLRTGNADDGPLSGRLAFDADLSCGRVGFGAREVTAVAVRLKVADGVFDADPVSLDLLGGSASGRFRSDLSGDTATHRLTFELEAFSAEALLKWLTEEEVGEGTLSLEAALSSEGRRAAEIWRHLAGTVLLDGESLTLHGVDLDKRVGDYESASTFDLYDVGAVLLVGPLGLAATRGRAFARLLSESDESTSVEQMRSEWHLEHGVAKAYDVALRTSRNLVALHGGLDLYEQRYIDVTVAVVDPGGCAFVEQRVTGTFDDPDVDSPSVLETLAAPGIDLFERAAELFGADGCDEPFYDGALAHPLNDD